MILHCGTYFPVAYIIPTQSSLHWGTSFICPWFLLYPTQFCINPVHICRVWNKKILPCFLCPPRQIGPKSLLSLCPSYKVHHHNNQSSLLPMSTRSSTRIKAWTSLHSKTTKLAQSIFCRCVPSKSQEIFYKNLQDHSLRSFQIGQNLE